MTKVRIVGPRDRLDELLERLYALRLVELADVAHEPGLDVAPLPAAVGRTSEREQLRLLLAEIDGLLDLAGRVHGEAEPSREAVDPDTVRAEVDRVAPRVEELIERREALRAEEVVLGRYVALLRYLLESVPELRVIDPELAALRLATVVLVLNTEETAVVELLREELGLQLGSRFLLLSVAMEGGALGCILVFPVRAGAVVRELLGRQRVRHVPLPEAYRDLSLGAAAEAMMARRGEIPLDLAAMQAELSELLASHAPAWSRARPALAARLDQLDAVRLLGATRRAFVVAAWLPRSELRLLREELRRGFGGELVVEELAAARKDRSAPVLLHNPAPARPFEFLVRVYDDPRARSLDPTGLVALFLPLMFGLMVGDVVYGALLLVAAVVLRAGFGLRSPLVRDMSRILAVGSLWAIVFGVVFGEALGDLGEKAGMPALWLHRDDRDALEPLLLLALAIGVVHVVLGLALGLWQSWRDRAPRGVLIHAGTLLVLAALCTLAGVAVEQLPAAAVTPAVAAAVVGLVVVSAAHGALGMLLGPLELVGTVGNVLSYLRLAAVGLASVYLAVVANELATLGPIWIGVAVAAFLHALNLALAGFTPAIQAVRLQYVEFFTQFFVGGGRSFRPFGPSEGVAERRPPHRTVETAPVQAGA